MFVLSIEFDCSIRIFVCAGQVTRSGGRVQLESGGAQEAIAEQAMHWTGFATDEQREFLR